jgi:hypothetical protein
MIIKFWNILSKSFIINHIQSVTQSHWISLVLCGVKNILQNWRILKNSLH